MSAHHYLIGLGSNVRHARLGGPRDVVRAALVRLEQKGATILACSSTIRSRPIGPSQRDYANAVALIALEATPPAALELLQSIEAAFGRRRRGQNWRARVLDLDIVLWDGGVWANPSLRIPHPEFRQRRFVVGPAAQIAVDWKDPISNLSLGQLNARLTRARRLPR